MRILAPLTALLLLIAGAPETSVALTIPLDPASTFVGTVDGVALGPGRTDGFPTGGSMGSITFEGDLAPSSTLQVTTLDFSQDFAFGYRCSGDICLPGFTTLPVTVQLEGPGSITIDSEGGTSGELHVIVGLEGIGDVAATLMVNLFGYPLTPGALTLQGVFQFDNPESPLADLQGVVLVPEPSAAAMLMVAVLVGGSRARTRFSSSAR